MSTKTLVILHMLFLIPCMSYVQLYAFFFLKVQIQGS